MERGQDLISVIVPVYNIKEYLERCVDSILAQTFRDFEVILVNDGSADVSLPICQMYAGVDPRIQVMDQENSGVSATRNAAIDRARGEFLQFVDADDRVEPSLLEKLYRCLEETGAEVSACGPTALR